MAGEEVASAWQVVRSHMGYTQDLGLVQQAAQAKPCAKLGQKVRQRAGGREVDPTPNPSSKLSWRTSSWRPIANGQGAN